MAADKHETHFFAAALLAGFLGAPAFAQTKVGDWDIEKRAQDEHCNASRAYKDSDCSLIPKTRSS
jgi:hypothetical protein